MPKVIIKDATLREGLDVPGVNFSSRQKLKIARMLKTIGVREIEVVAPGKVLKDLAFVKKLKGKRSYPKTSGLIYAYSPYYRPQIEKISGYLDRLDILMPASFKREPCQKKDKIKQLCDALIFASRFRIEVGAGFPHSFQTPFAFLLEISKEAVRKGAQRITVYDTNGSADPFTVHDMIRRLRKHLDCPLFFHGHNDLGLATANSLAAVYAGADGLDATANGLGDRAGNASLEQMALLLHLRGFKTGIALKGLRPLSKVVERASGISISRIAPVVGEYIFSHKSAAHSINPELFLAFDPRWI